MDMNASTKEESTNPGTAVGTVAYMSPSKCEERNWIPAPIVLLRCRALRNRHRNIAIPWRNHRIDL